MTLSAQSWNAMVRALRRWWPLDWRPAEPASWAHPWQVTARWDAALESWSATVNPGFVNGMDPTVKLAYELAPLVTRRRIGRAERKAAVDAWLTEGPQMLLTDWRTPSPVPDYFVARGVAATAVATDEPLAGQPSPVARRIVQAMDIVLHQPRAASRIDVQGSTIGGAEGTGARVLVNYSGSAGRAYVRAVRELVDDPPITSAGLIDGSQSDTGIDRRLIASVYLLSPDGVTEGEPDATWQPHIRHGLFWNVAYRASGRPGAAPEDLRLDVPLAAGLAQPLIGAILAQVNDATSAVAQFLAARVGRGRFWSV